VVRPVAAAIANEVPAPSPLAAPAAPLSIETAPTKQPAAVSGVERLLQQSRSK
jgi:hypothetical protein